MRIVETLKVAGKLLILDMRSIAMVKWIIKKGDATLRMDYDLKPDSVIFDVGGYRGEWAKDMSGRYGSYIHIFEPVDEYYEEIKQKLSSNPKITVNKAGLADKTGSQMISIDEDGSSLVKLDGKVMEINLTDIAEYIVRHGITRVDLMKLNIEGGEYALLDRMHEIGFIEKCGDIQIQFHDFFPTAKEHRNKLRKILSTTHELTYDYPFIWENWRRKKN
jgi:FkbM family methyltransferase